MSRLHCSGNIAFLLVNCGFDGKVDERPNGWSRLSIAEAREFRRTTPAVAARAELITGRGSSVGCRPWP